MHHEDTDDGGKLIDKKLTDFSYDHYSTINQVFGTDIVQQVIPFDSRQEDAVIRPIGRMDEENILYKRLKIDNSSGWRSDRYSKNFDVHFVVQEGPYFLRSRIRDPIADGIQPHVGNDTLCQSYALLNLYGIEWSSNSHKNQRKMIQFYRRLLDSREFNKQMEDVLMQYDVAWKDFKTKKPLLNLKSLHPTKKQLRKAWKTLTKRMRRVLSDWENFGMDYFASD